MLANSEIIESLYSLGLTIVVFVSFKRIVLTLERNLTTVYNTISTFLEKNKLESDKARFLGYLPENIQKTHTSFPSPAMQILLSRSYGFSFADMMLIQAGIDLYLSRLDTIKTGFIKKMLTEVKGISLNDDTITSLELPKTQWADMKQALQLIVSAIENNDNKLDLTPEQYAIWRVLSQAYEKECQYQKTKLPDQPYQVVLFLDINSTKKPFDNIAEILSKNGLPDFFNGLILVYLHDDVATKDEKVLAVERELEAALQKKNIPTFSMSIYPINASKYDKNIISYGLIEYLRGTDTKQLLLINYPEQQVFKRYLEQLDLKTEILTASMPKSLNDEETLARWLDTLSFIFRLKDSEHRKMYSKSEQDVLKKMKPLTFSYNMHTFSSSIENSQEVFLQTHNTERRKNTILNTI